MKINQEPLLRCDSPEEEVTQRRIARWVIKDQSRNDMSTSLVATEQV